MELIEPTLIWRNRFLVDFSGSHTPGGYSVQPIPSFKDRLPGKIKAYRSVQGEQAGVLI